MNELENRVLIKQEIREESNFEEIKGPIYSYNTFGSQREGDCFDELQNKEYSYDVYVCQKIAEIEGKGKEMEISTATVCQLIQENTESIGERFIVNFDTIADMTDEQKN